ncbi:type VII secretion integral membrane protein EccD [Hoyosella sp. YIM 151337]|uniref:type VII secretion integral membrane protein EccD n=1 Tax=Hoyosella sp. YIM 151337 TaxID=2992742 RepID=UPI002236B0DE|nr:type VII secretion integral membrane protein EccD [Hoyosella sp. YIM 151337]MCW4352529.1 type VII secretion integral membrane protein EccD [Hoyosella sp. YIM 151337]
MVESDVELARTHALCHVCVAIGETQVDVAIPASVPLVLLLPELVDIAAARAAERRRPDVRDSSRSWSLARVGQGPLDTDFSLAQLGVRNGDLLVLSPSSETPPPPLFDDIVEAIAQQPNGWPSDATDSWRAGRARVLSHCVMAAAGLTASAVLLASEPLTHLPLALAALLASPAALAAAFSSQSRAGARAAAILTLVTALVTAAAAAHLVPGPMSALHAIVFAIVAACLAVIGLRLFRAEAHILVPVVVAACVVLLTAGATVVLDTKPAAAAAAVIAAAPFMIAVAPRCALLLARLPLPPVPPPGAVLNVVDAVHDAAETGADDLIAHEERYHRLQQQAVVTQRYLTGIVAAAAVTTTSATALLAWNFAREGAFTLPDLLLVAAVAGSLLLRGRGLAGSAPALLVTGSGAAMVLCVLSAGAVFASGAVAAAVFGGALLTVALSFVFGAVLPGRVFTPLQYRLAELTEYTLLASIVPLACWALGVFALIRGL